MPTRFTLIIQNPKRKAKDLSLTDALSVEVALYQVIPDLKHLHIDANDITTFTAELSEDDDILAKRKELEEKLTYCNLILDQFDWRIV